MKYFVKIFLLIFSFAGCAMVYTSVHASFVSDLSGKIVLQVEKNGEAWYINPDDYKRYFLGRPDDAWNLMRALGLGISNAEIEKIPIHDEKDTSFSNGAERAPSPSLVNQGEVYIDPEKCLNGDVSTCLPINDTQNKNPVNSEKQYDDELRTRLAGKILLQVESHGEAWYVHPDTKIRYFLGRPADAFRIMSKLGLGITDENLSRIRPSDEVLENDVYSFSIKEISTEKGNVWVRMISLDRSKGIRISVLSGDIFDCEKDCKAKSIYKYFHEIPNAIVAINGSYFCPDDDIKCVDQKRATFWPLYGTNTKTFFNSDKINFTDGSMLAVTEDGDFHYFHRVSEIQNEKWFEFATGKKLYGAITSGPSLVEYGKVVVDKEFMNKMQSSQNKARMSIGYNNDRLFIVYTSSSTVPAMAYVMKELGAEFALNLDGGRSGAMMLGGVYYVGPGQDVPNALVISRK